jgi:hypothetical protein
MNFITLRVKERLVPQHTFRFIYLCCLPDDGRMERPKHAVGR